MSFELAAIGLFEADAMPPAKNWGLCSCSTELHQFTLAVRVTGDSQLRETLQEIVDLQASYSASATPAMERRGLLVRKTLSADIESHGAKLRSLLGKFGDDAQAEGRDNQGQYARIPWARWFSASRSPSATTGWYVVYLFHPDGSGVSLCLSHGSTQIVGTGFVNRSDAELAELMSWAASVLGSEFEGDPGIRLGIELGSFDLVNRGVLIKDAGGA